MSDYPYCERGEPNCLDQNCICEDTPAYRRKFRRAQHGSDHVQLGHLAAFEPVTETEYGEAVRFSRRVAGAIAFLCLLVYAFLLAGSKGDTVMFGLLSPLGLVVVAGYFYVAVAIARAEHRAGATMGTMLVKATTWPVTIFHTIQKLYLTKPR